MHRKIYRAIRARNPDAARLAMSEHLMLAERSLAAEEAINETPAQKKAAKNEEDLSEASGVAVGL